MSVTEWFAVDVLVEVQAAEAVESAFNTLDCLGTETEIWLISPGDQIRVSGFFSERPDIAEVEIAVKNALHVYGFTTGPKAIFVRTIEQADWLAEWKKYWKPIEVGRFIVAPPWAEIAETDKYVIRIEPNMAFGTGTHETTQLCLRAISEILQPGRSFLDVGTGTGILAIAAAKLGAEPILGCDTDIDAITIARKNAKANGVADKIRHTHRSIDNKTPIFDFVCANLTLDVIVPLLPALIGKSRHVLLLSGILREQETAVRKELLTFGISNFKSELAGEWLSVLISK